ncbi:hypothetical protein APX70_200228 [Pseudomonas syringae pv. maculicola]|uniref:Uncharacterized protein n=1 Tax=Pseudomonas syringae pv. maculicola TaxID=59511 RepID=A0A3M2WF69_PSEYM|nr:hypothetical protein APX70_200228 [Pseudomonas syringae pv. maculicola]
MPTAPSPGLTTSIGQVLPVIWPSKLIVPVLADTAVPVRAVARARPSADSVLFTMITLLIGLVEKFGNVTM